MREIVNWVDLPRKEQQRMLGIGPPDPSVRILKRTLYEVFENGSVKRTQKKVKK